MNSQLTLSFLHHGQTRTLGKHSKVRNAVKHGRMDLAAAMRAPWYLRLTVEVEGKPVERAFKLGALAKQQVIIEARDFLNARETKPNAFASFIAAREAAAGVTLGQLAAEWTGAGMPFHKTKTRDAGAVENLSGFLTRALEWWAAKPVATVTKVTIEDYAAHRAPALRSADLELNALSCLCNWAMLTGRTAANPFAKRARFAETKQHCHEACPDNDDTFHKVIGWLFETPVHNKRTPARQNIIVGAWLCFTGLSGLRPGEPKFLGRHAPLGKTPANLAQLEPGTIFPDRTGQLRMKVQREKRGQNPFITLHPALVEFLSTWRAWLATHMPESTRLFPLATEDQTVLNRALDQASEALKLPHYKPHGFGRAYYVRVRRSQGAEDNTIAGELGQTTNGDLIRSVYGDPQDLHGGNMHDWLPDDVAISWALLTVSSAVSQSEMPLKTKAISETSADS